MTSYAYPSPRTGTAQDLMRVITLAAERELEKGHVLPAKSEAARRWLEPACRLFGVAVAGVLELVPADWGVAFHERLFRALAAPHRYPFDAAAATLARARALTEALRRRAGREPALLALISHPPVLGDLAHMNLELVRHTTHALRAIRGRPCRPRLVTAIDPFALDTLSLYEEGIYAGFMGTFHLGIDRLSLGRGHLGPLLTPGASWHAMAPRLLRVLGRGGEVGLVPSGGIPGTGRVLYGAREWVGAARRESPRRARPADVARALAAEPAFAGFAQFEPELPRPPGVWRLLDLWLMAATVGLLPGLAPADAARAILSALDVPAPRREPLLAELRVDLTRETPRRRRLFRLIAGRVARRRPVVFVPIVHGTEPPGVSVGEAWAWESSSGGRVRFARADGPEAVREATPDEFADLFVEENFR